MKDLYRAMEMVNSSKKDDETLDLDRAITLLKEERAVLALDVLYGKDSYYTAELSEALKIAIDALESIN